MVLDGGGAVGRVFLGDRGRGLLGGGSVRVGGGFWCWRAFESPVEWGWGLVPLASELTAGSGSAVFEGLEGVLIGIAEDVVWGVMHPRRAVHDGSGTSSHHESPISPDWGRPWWRTGELVSGGEYGGVGVGLCVLMA